MPRLFDYHTHTSHSIDARGSLESLVRAAQTVGISDLASTEHFDFVPSDSSCGFFKPDTYIAEATRVKALSSDVRLAIGIELGIEAEHITQALAVRALPAYEHLDFAIGSVHAVGGQMLGDGYYIDRTRKQAFGDYFESMMRSLDTIGKTGLVNVIGHFDLVRRYAPVGFCDGWFAESEDMVRDVLRTMVDLGIGLEINVSGFRQSSAEQYPSLDVLRLYRAFGGEILTIGSDSHSPEMVIQSAGRLAMGLDVARQAGFKYVTVYEKRRPSFVAI